MLLRYLGTCGQALAPVSDEGNDIGTSGDVAYTMAKNCKIQKGMRKFCPHVSLYPSSEEHCRCSC